MRSFVASDLCLLRVTTYAACGGAQPFVYDLSVPGCENFVAGEGAIACHNSRGQQGIGISAAAMYGQLTTGKPIRVTSRVGKRKAAHVFDIQLDTRKNEPVVTHDETLAQWHQEHGTRVELEIVANWQQGQRFVNRYVEHTALANPHATIHYTRPVGAAQRARRRPAGQRDAELPARHDRAAQGGARDQAASRTASSSARSCSWRGSRRATTSAASCRRRFSRVSASGRRRDPGQGALGQEGGAGRASSARTARWRRSCTRPSPRRSS